MTYSRIVFERGIEISAARNAVETPTAGLTLEQVFAGVWESYNVRPILLTERVRSIDDLPSERHMVLTLDGLELLGLRVGSLALPRGTSEENYVSLYRPATNAQYIAGALLYHCQQLALHYSRICDEAVELQQTTQSESDFVTYGNQAEPYYELEALITAARRTYDSLRFILWKAFGPGGKDTPRNFRRTLAACDKMPAILRSSLETSWATYGEKMTAYRDCIQHYEPVTFGLQSASLERVHGKTWSLRLPLPDNPEHKSQRSFTFAKNLDALSYGWELANEAIRVAIEVFGSITNNSQQ